MVYVYIKKKKMLITHLVIEDPLRRLLYIPRKFKLGVASASRDVSLFPPYLKKKKLLLLEIFIALDIVGKISIKVAFLLRERVIDKQLKYLSVSTLRF